MARDVLKAAIEQFNLAATGLQQGEFRRSRTPNESARTAQTRHSRDYDQLLSAVVPLTRAFEAANATRRARTAARLNADAVFILKVFAGYMPVLAVRRGSPDLIWAALIALAAVGGTDDIRDLTVYVAALHHSAMKLGMNTRELFDAVAGLVPSTDLEQVIRSFPLRAAENRDLAAFWLRETGTGGGFDIVSCSPDSN